MSRSICRIEACERPTAAGGLCRRHRERWAVRPVDLWGTGLVYFIAEPVSNYRYYVKVGYTHSYEQLTQRLCDLQIGNPRPLELLAVVEHVNIEAESVIHVLWDRWRVRGEWFDVPEVTVDRVASKGTIGRLPGGLQIRPFGGRS